MTAIQVQQTDSDVVINIPKSSIEPKLLLAILQRFRFEELIQKAAFQDDIEDFGDEIKNDWWQKNRETYLKGIV
jgi:hypothetical protein